MAPSVVRPAFGVRVITAGCPGATRQENRPWPRTASRRRAIPACMPDIPCTRLHFSLQAVKKFPAPDHRVCAEKPCSPREKARTKRLHRTGKFPAIPCKAGKIRPTAGPWCAARGPMARSIAAGPGRGQSSSQGQGPRQGQGQGHGHGPRRGHGRFMARASGGSGWALAAPRRRASRQTISGAIGRGRSAHGDGGAGTTVRAIPFRRFRAADPVLAIRCAIRPGPIWPGPLRPGPMRSGRYRTGTTVRALRNRNNGPGEPARLIARP